MGLTYFNSSWGGYIEYEAETILQDFASHQSTVRVNVWIGSTSQIDLLDTNGNTVSVVVGGIEKNIPIGSLQLNNSKKFLGHVDYSIRHNNDGSGTVDIRLFSNMSNLHYRDRIMGRVEVDFVHAIKKITQNGLLSVGAGIIGSDLLIKINQINNNLKYTLKYSWNNKSGLITSNATSINNWRIPNDFAYDIPNTNKGTGTITVEVFSGNSKISVQQVAFTATINDNMKPTLGGITLTDTNNTIKNLLTGNNFLQIFSNIQVNFTGVSGSYGSTIKEFKAEIVNKNQSISSNGASLGIMNFHGSAIVRASVIDSRGKRSDYRDITINVAEYFPPTLHFSAVRTRSNPNAIQVIRNAKIAPIEIAGVQKNEMRLSFKVAPIGTKNFSNDNSGASGTWGTQHNFNNSAANLSGNYPANKSFEIIGTLSDRFTRTEFSVTVTAESVVMSYDKNGRVGIGKPIEYGKPGSLDVAGDIYSGGKQIQQHQLSRNDGYNHRNTYSNLDNYVYSGFYYIDSSALPNKAGGYLIVESYDTKFVKQTYTPYNSNITYSRLQNKGIWTPWKEFAFKDDLNNLINHSNLVNTGWKTGSNGSSYKRSGDILAIKYNFVGNGGTVTLANIPKEIFTSSQNYYQAIFPNVQYGNDRAYVTIKNNSSKIEVINSYDRARYEGQLIIML